MFFPKEIKDYKYIISHWLFINITLSDISMFLAQKSLQNKII